jgi:hypothetical protein
LVKREEGMARSFDDLATGLDTGAITRGRAMKLAGAALVASALGLVGAGEAQGEELGTEGIRRRHCSYMLRGGQRQEEASQGVLRFSGV